ncbi:MAG: molybdopterin-dependent oxidoreductase [Deltaproteobacteria bacterium]|nr:molybdopterin-dependent oxidoreductase [Deltaproteobacteria bacterium]
MPSRNRVGVRTRRDGIVRKLKNLHADEEVLYTGCRINCGGSQCVLKVRRRNGKVTAIEPDDHYNRGVGREDAVVSDLDLIKNRLQLRGCPMGWMFHKLATSPERILYPMKRVEGTKRGEGKFERITWNEALDLVANKMKEVAERYGPYSVFTPYAPNARLERLFGLWGAGIEGWGWCSMDPGRLAMHLMAGVPGWSYGEGSNDMADFLMNTKMIVLWGFEPTITHFGPGHQLAYYIKMARERGTPVICIDCRYTVAAEVLADQWIPIKPGTDAAMMLAVANVLIRENLYNKEFVAKYVDQGGFEKWRAYIFGETDGIEKTPEWAEKICTVPAETIREFARLYARMKPTWLWKGYGLDRKSRGENTARGAASLQAIMGYWGVAGGSVPLHLRFRDKPSVLMPYGDIPRRMIPKMYRSHKWAQMVLLQDKVRSGEMSVEEYKRKIGWRTGPLPKRPLSRVWAGGTAGGAIEDTIEDNGTATEETLPNPKMMLWGTYYGPGTNTLNNNVDSTNDQLKALEKLEFVVWAGTQMASMARHADVIFPLTEMTLEQRTIQTAGYGGFANYTFLPGVVPPQGEARPDDWVYSELARRLGIGEQYNRYYKRGNWDESWERYLRDEYRSCAKALRKQGVKAPQWRKFTKDCLINVDEAYDEPWHGYKSFIEGGKPLKTRSGKIELYSHIVGDESQRGKLHFDDHGQLIDNLPNDWRDLAPFAAYQPIYRGMDHADVKRFPLMLLSCYPRYRNHTTFWNIPWLRGDCYRHAIWMNAADAQARGIKDGDLVRIHNDKGVGVLPAYVTSRILPGMVVIHHGGNYEPDKDGVDWGCTPNIFFTDMESPVTAPAVTNLVEAERYVAQAEPV